MNTPQPQSDASAFVQFSPTKSNTQYSDVRALVLAARQLYQKNGSKPNLEEVHDFIEITPELRELKYSRTW